MPELVREMVGKAEEEAEGAVFEIDSPGGTPYPTKEIVQAVKGFGKPTVARIKENGLSGAYWIASSCDRIVADELSRVGGIGVSAFQPDFSELLEKLGIKFKSSATGKYKERGIPFGGGEEEDFMKEQLEQVNEIFAESVAEARDLDEDEAEEVFEGKPYLGREAKEVGLVDRLGGRKEAVEECREMMGAEEAEIVDYGKRMEEESKGLLGSVLEQLFG
ncbi:hypothetical protein AKJ65_05160 [candidate division MSBL1 archaeon SCGC-AAA259E19]|uniref:Peptidase S49 domain-containing protein n=2 Tax=candidate division MSBL1 TaxID=215777 RepID=A0A133UZM6_9EURY|nr:hypothetical protein AKJ65_05160 [candidate division MSBL1 archaeon SCGC-AAA259E19]KXA99622.1 hypothetical protein AKJ41_05140 [candidate division MSBL1 archaeon SCGC-AAA259O05]